MDVSGASKMKLSPLALCGAAVTLLLASTGSARAELIPWLYSWSSAPTVLQADAPGTSTITLSSEPLKEAIGDSDIVATNLRTYSTASPSNPDTFTHANYTLSLYLYDPTNHQGNTLTFTGFIDGTLSGQNSDLSNTFTGLTNQTLLLGDHLFTANALSYSPPGIPGAVNAGSIGGHVMITVQTVMTLPEPGSLALSGLGMLLLGVARLRAGRKRAAQQQEST
jgi:hypothetical protein